MRDFETLENTKDKKWIIGRIMSIRGQGAIMFITFTMEQDLSRCFKVRCTRRREIKFFNEVIDIGDFVEINGTFYH